ncbi:MAG: hypothetical protein ACYC5Q_07980 [Thermoleophilia bacterium]
MGYSGWGNRAGVTLLAVLAIAAAVVLALALAPEAQAKPAFAHGAAQSCTDCHHADSFRPCSECHADVATPNSKCITCHPGRTTKGESCGQCHQPGAPQPPATDAGCQTCHGAAPHLGANPACTTCHSTTPTPHHDSVDQVAPQTCTGCHQHAEAPSHSGQACTICHATDVHPNIPETPAVCNACHAAETFNGRGACTACHAGTAAFGGRTDNDIHDDTLPDSPISATSCTSCHEGRRKHAGSVACRTCHTAATAFHHGTAASPGFPTCASCHGQKPQHGPGLDCSACHEQAQHEADPPTPSAANCLRCHDAATRGARDCLACHRTPVYHASHAVGGCSSCHGSKRALHARLLQCRECHTNSDRGHHLTSVFRPRCTNKGCHVTLEKHRGTVECTACHGSAAMHDRTPKNLPADTWSVCDRCHTFTKAALAAGVPACSECHDTAQHAADYRVKNCSECHDKTRHADKVECRSCHTSLGEGHHKAGRVAARECSECHIDKAIHASGTQTGASFTCGTCHDGSVHGVLSRPAPSFCGTCHEKAADHAGGNACTECHWPAAHAARPNAAEYGTYIHVAVKLPADAVAAAETPEDQRPIFTGTGFYWLEALVAGLTLLGAGIVLRRRSDPGRIG